MNSYHGGVSESSEWVQPLTSTLSYHAHATLGDHHHSHHGHSNHNHSHGPSHPHTYPSQHLPTSIVDHVSAPLMESPSYSQDRESIHSERGGDDREDTANTAPHNSLPPISSYPLSTMCPLPSQAFKRSYQPEIITPVSSPQPSKRRKSTSKEAWTMTEDDNLLLKLKDEEGLPWKVIANRFREMNRGEFRVPTLQMRYKRLKEKMRVWDAEDLQYLKEAKEYVEKQKWELISQRMLEIGCKKKIPGSTCEKKWKEICPQPINTQQLPGASGPNSASTDSAISMTSHGLAQACDMKRELSQVSEEEVEGLGVHVKMERE